MKLSIIVPAYNVSQWIERCIYSLVNQDIDQNNYEVIIVNDGSKDDTMQLAEKIIDKYPNNFIRLINQTNKGLAGARNTGIRHAVGKYVLFVDPDDYIETNVLAEMLEFTESNDLEIAMFGQNIIQNGVKKTRDNRNPNTSHIMKGLELFFKRTSDSACKYLINTEYLKGNDLYFFEKAVYLEDGEWSPRMFSKASRTAYKGIYFYNYELRSGSLVTSGVAVSNKALAGYMLSAKNLKKFKERDDLTQTQKEFVNYTIAKFVLLPIVLCATPRGIRQIFHIRKTILKAGFPQLEIIGLTGERLKQAKLYNKSVFLLFCYLLKKNFWTSRQRKRVL